MARKKSSKEIDTIYALQRAIVNHPKLADIDPIDWLQRAIRNLEIGSLDGYNLAGDEIGVCGISLPLISITKQRHEAYLGNKSLDLELVNLSCKAIKSILSVPVPQLLQCLKHENRVVRITALENLGKPGQEVTNEAVSVVKGLISTDDEELRKAAENALKEFATTRTYQVILDDKNVSAGQDIDNIKRLLRSLIDYNDEKINELFSVQPVILATDKDFDTAYNMKTAMQDAGIPCRFNMISEVDSSIFD
jgi:hypothetical protein